MAIAGRKVLVTGAGGFIGSHLVERLVQEGARVKAFLRYNSRSDRGLLELVPRELLGEVELAWGDLRDASTVEQATQGSEVILHLASLIGIPYSYLAPDAYIETNVKGTLHLLQAALRRGTACFVHTSTSEVYGTARQVPIKESHPLHAQSPYAASKIAADQLAQSFHLAYGLPVAIIRPFNTFGPRQSARAVVANIVCQALQKEEISLGSTEPKRDFTYVKDVVEAFIRVASTPAAVGEVINVGSGQEITIGQLAQLVLHLTGRDIPIRKEEQRMRPVRSEVLRLVCDPQKARELLGWQPLTSLEEGLIHVIDFVREHHQRYRPEEYAV